MKKVARALFGLFLGAVLAGTQMGGCELPSTVDEDGTQVHGSVAGAWTGTNFSLSCDLTNPPTETIPPASWTLTLTQLGTHLSGTVSVTSGAETYAGNFDGTLNGGALDFTMTLNKTSAPPCAVALSGTGTRSGNTLQIDFSGTSDCCGGGTVSGSATGTLQ